MVIRRIREHVATHNWFAVGIDFAIVVAGIVIGTQVNNWNQGRIEAAQGRSYRERLIDEVRFNEQQFQAQAAYYHQAQSYGRQALEALTGKAPLSDQDFLIAVYQLSQTDTTPAKSYIYDEMTANGMVSRIGDTKFQAAASDYYLSLNASDRLIAEAYPYRTLIRAVMPYDLQEQIRDACGDRAVSVNGQLVGVKLVVPCPVRLEPAAAASAVRTIRSTPQMKEEMTRYIASLDEKLDQLEPGVAFSGQLRRELGVGTAATAP